VRAANDKAFKALNEAYQSLMDGSHRSGPQGRAAAYGRGTYGAYTGSYGGSYGAAGSRAGGGFDPNYNPFQSYYRQGTGGSYWGWKQYARRGGSGLDFASLLRSFAGLGRAHAAAMTALGLLVAGGLLVAEPLTSSLWASHNDGVRRAVHDAPAVL
jgi:curved DNA-binding protein CbpA